MRHEASFWQSWIAIVLSGLAVSCFTGCHAQTRQKTLSLLLDGVSDTPAPPVRRVRRDLLREIDELKRQLQEARGEAVRAKESAAASPEAAAASDEAKPIEQARSWEDAAKLLPVTEEMPDWSRALRDGVIAPKPGTDPQAPPQPVMSLDVELIPESDPAYKVVFSHESHTAWLSCANCHPGIFQTRRGADAITMEQISAGRSCGVCHGTVAFSSDACTRCHRGLAE